MPMQLELPLEDYEEPEADTWSYGMVELEDGSVVLAEIAWTEDDLPFGWCEATFTLERPANAPQDFDRLFATALFDIRDQEPIPVGHFPHMPRLSED